MRQPNSDLTSNQSSLSRCPTTSPTTRSPGPAWRAALAAPAISPSVDTIVRWSTVVPRRVTATGETGVGTGGHEPGGDVGRAIGAVEEDDRRAGRGELGPGQVGVVGVDDAHLADTAAGQAEACVRRNAGDLADARGDLELDARLAQCAGLVEERAVDHRIARDEPNRRAALACRLDDERAATGLVEGHAVGVDGDDDLGVRTRVRPGDGHRVRVDDDDVRAGDEAGGAQGQQIGIPGTRGDERDGPVHRLLAGLGSLDHGLGVDDRLGLCGRRGLDLRGRGLLGHRLRGRRRLSSRPASRPPRLASRPASRPARPSWRRLLAGAAFFAAGPAWPRLGAAFFAPGFTAYGLLVTSLGCRLAVGDSRCHALIASPSESV